MGVYHLAGLGRSIGAVTAAFSSLAACKELPEAATDPLFAHSGSKGEGPAARGAVEALVLFTTREIVDDVENCDAYEMNRAGQSSGPEYSGGFHRALKSNLRAEIRPLARKETGGDGNPTGRLKPVELYWCIYEDDDPVGTFERAARVMRALRTAAGEPGRVGHEFWVNLTGGRNIINSALQLAASLTGAPARMYYLLSANPRCVRHTVRPVNLRTDRDRFWVDLPVVYLGFSDTHLKIMEAIGILGEDERPVPLDELLGQMTGELANRDRLIHGYLRPLSGQRLIVRETDAHGRDVYRMGEGWARERRYLAALRHDEDNPTLRSLPELAQTQPDWFRHEQLAFD